MGALINAGRRKSEIPKSTTFKIWRAAIFIIYLPSMLNQHIMRIIIKGFSWRSCSTLQSTRISFCSATPQYWPVYPPETAEISKTCATGSPCWGRSSLGSYSNVSSQLWSCSLSVSPAPKRIQTISLEFFWMREVPLILSPWRRPLLLE